jgi:hypothetical protein
MKICFIAAGGIEWGSSRMRAYWVAEAMQQRGIDATAVDVNTHTDYRSADAYIFQKIAPIEAVKTLTEVGIKCYLDVCDPSWWWQPNECREIAQHMTAVVASSQPLADDFNQWYGQGKAICIPDRLDLAHFPKQRDHADVTPVRFIWFGVAVNRIALLGAIPFLERLVANGRKIELTIMDDRPDLPMQWTNAFPIYHTKWTLDTEVKILASHDIALLPPYPGAWGRVKSNNKQLTAWACGLPVYAGEEYTYLENLVTQSGYRESMAAGGMDFVSNNSQITQSAAEWEAVLCG